MNELLQNKALLCKVSISQFNPKRTDSKTTSEVLMEKKAGRSAGVWIKYLVDPKALDQVTKIGASARQEHYELSLPWADEGWRILPITAYFIYQEKMKECKRKFEFETDRFLEHWPEYVENAKFALNDMYNPADYPSLERIKRKFDFDVDFIPMPSGNDFRIDLAEEEIEKMRGEVDQRVMEAGERAMSDLWERLATPIRNMSEKLSKTDAIFRDSLVDNLREIIKLVPMLNISEDENLNKMVEEAKEKLTTIPPEVLREDTLARKSVAKQAEDILSRMEGYF